MQGKLFSKPCHQISAPSVQNKGERQLHFYALQRKIRLRFPKASLKSFLRLPGQYLFAKESYYFDDKLFENDHKESKHFFTDEKALEVFKATTKLPSTSAVESLCRVERNRFVRKLREKGLTVKQVARLMDISETTVKRLCQMSP